MRRSRRRPSGRRRFFILPGRLGFPCPRPATASQRRDSGSSPGFSVRAPRIRCDFLPQSAARSSPSTTRPILLAASPPSDEATSSHVSIWRNFAVPRPISHAYPIAPRHSTHRRPGTERKLNIICCAKKKPARQGVSVCASVQPRVLCGQYLPS